MIKMFRTASAFNQNISNWCVSNISGTPDNFSTQSALSSANQPIWGSCRTSFATITFNDENKVFGDSDFVLSPTSNGSGTFTFSIADTSVATVAGSTVTIVGAGTTVITAIQAGDTAYFSTTATMTLTVVKGNPTITFAGHNQKNSDDADFQPYLQHPIAQVSLPIR